MAMVHDDDHDDNDGCELCPRCQFIDRVGDYLDAAASDGDEDWQAAVGPLIDRMHGALWAMQRLWSERFTDEHREIDNTGEAARAIVELYERIHALRHD